MKYAIKDTDFTRFVKIDYFQSLNRISLFTAGTMKSVTNRLKPRVRLWDLLWGLIRQVQSTAFKKPKTPSIPKLVLPFC